MAIVVRFVDRNGFIKERFLDLVHVKDTNALTLKNEILSSLSHLKLDVQDIRGQGYDGASNMRGEWNGLQALILNECPFAYYVHCFAHQLQLALVAASKDVSEVHTFFKHLNFIVNVIGSSTKRNDQLQDAQLAEISHLAKIGELEGGRGANQMQNIQRPGDTRWSLHFKSICSLVRLFGPTHEVLNDICIGRSTGPQKGDAKYALTHLLSFDFVLVLHLMKKIMEITDKLCKFLQNKSQDIVNALTLVSTTKTLIQKLRDDGWQSLIDQVVCFCDKYNIPVPDMSATYRDIIRSRNKKDDVTVEHHYRVDVFIVAIDSQLQELNNSVTLDPKKSFNADDICKLVTKYYPLDFTEQERIELRLELQHFKLDSDPELKNVSSLSALYRGLRKTK
ncbi:zinc finger MYM-type protein 1-like protein [Tanacetum coccineum]